jgi:hypothetical protein
MAVFLLSPKQPDAAPLAVIWVPDIFSDEVAKVSPDKRFGWVGLIRAKINFLRRSKTRWKTSLATIEAVRRHLLTHCDDPVPVISGSPQEQLPSDLRSAPFIPKPFYPAQIERVLQAIVD